MGIDFEARRKLGPRRYRKVKGESWSYSYGSFATILRVLRHNAPLGTDMSLLEKATQNGYERIRWRPADCRFIARTLRHILSANPPRVDVSRRTLTFDNSKWQNAVRYGMYEQEDVQVMMDSERLRRLHLPPVGVDEDLLIIDFDAEVLQFADKLQHWAEMHYHVKLW